MRAFTVRTKSSHVGYGLEPGAMFSRQRLFRSVRTRHYRLRQLGLGISAICLEGSATHCIDPAIFRSGTTGGSFSTTCCRNLHQATPFSSLPYLIVCPASTGRGGGIQWNFRFCPTPRGSQPRHCRGGLGPMALQSAHRTG